MVELGIPRIRRKRDAYRLESGPASFTRRVEDLGARTVVVGRDGSRHDSADWPASRTFWQGAQENLLVADNQTDDYAEADSGGRRLLSQFAWGPGQIPAEPCAPTATSLRRDDLPETPIDGAWVVTPEPIEDQRGLFARTFCTEEFAARGLDTRVAQCNTSFNARAGTLRGTALPGRAGRRGQAGPLHAGRDLRRRRRPRPARPPTGVVRGRAERGQPARLLHPGGLRPWLPDPQDASEVLYQMSTPYVPGAGRGVRWDDPAFGISGPSHRRRPDHGRARRRLSGLRAVSRVLVTGATGFVGRGTLEPLIAAGMEVHAVTSRPAPDRRTQRGALARGRPADRRRGAGGDDRGDPPPAPGLDAEPGRFWTSPATWTGWRRACA